MATQTTDTVRLSPDAWAEITAHVEACIESDKRTGHAKEVLTELNSQIDTAFSDDPRVSTRAIEIELTPVKWNYLTGALGRIRSMYLDTDHIDAALNVERYINALKTRLEHQRIMAPANRNQQFDATGINVSEIASDNKNTPPTAD
ncbi:hypothetical protein [Salinibaculum rarum]|uniref:hypothetical protein n=1 Tax=Salinibaculum rarum TaxID=3058903 RepID=UPI00265DAC6D|nr:hypothetical protein [Salinibaculum sp. KK48]